MSVNVEFSAPYPGRSGVRVAEVMLSWVPGCDQHPGKGALRLEMHWNGVRDGEHATYAYHVDTCGGCGRVLEKK